VRGQVFDMSLSVEKEKIMGALGEEPVGSKLYQ
jgi:hypothetical protein